MKIGHRQVGLFEGEEPTVAFVGVAKNSGKTTTLGYVLNRAVEEHTVGLVSIGVDGEEAGAITEIDKPSIELPSGHWIASAADGFARSTARFEFAHELGFSTSLGRAQIARTIDAGEVVLAGMRHRRDLVGARDSLYGCGADCVLIDGAYGRTLTADGRIADGIVLSTGAVLADNVDDIVEATRPAVESLMLQAPDSEMARDAAERALAGRGLYGVVDDEVVEVSCQSALTGLDETLEEYADTLRMLAIPGALTDSLAKSLVAHDDSPRTLVVTSPASLQVEPINWTRLQTSNWSLGVLHPVDLLAISANPTNPSGRHVDSTQLLDALTRAFPRIPIFNPLSGR